MLARWTHAGARSAEIRRFPLRGCDKIGGIGFRPVELSGFPNQNDKREAYPTKNAWPLRTDANAGTHGANFG
jgi:hypothetical protein